MVLFDSSRAPKARARVFARLHSLLSLVDSPQ